MKKLSNTSKAVAAATGTGIFATTISIPFMLGEQVSKDALRPVLEKEGLTPFTRYTDKNLILTSLAQGLSDEFEFTTIPASSFYVGSPAITIDTSETKGISIDDPAIEQLRAVCMQALNNSGGYKSTTKKWCAEITIEEILKRQGLKTLNTEEQAKNSLLHKLILPISEFSIEKDTFYDNSSQIFITTTTAGSKKIFQLDQPKTELKKQCLQALQNKKLGDKQKYLKNARTWCLQLSVKDALIRNGFEPLNGNEDDNVWKEIIAGGWFGSATFFTQKNFSSEKNLFNITGSSAVDGVGGIKEISKVESKHISALKRGCTKLLTQPFVREKFPKDFDNNSFPLFDPFQEASWLCVKPRTVKDFVEKNLRKTFDVSKDSFCLEKENWKTYKVWEESFVIKDFWDYVKSSITISIEDAKTCIKESN